MTHQSLCVKNPIRYHAVQLHLCTECGDCIAMCILHMAFASEKQEEPIKGSIKKLISTYRNTHVHRQTCAFTHTRTHMHTVPQHTHIHTHRKQTNTHTQWFPKRLGILMRAITKARVNVNVAQSVSITTVHLRVDALHAGVCRSTGRPRMLMRPGVCASVCDIVLSARLSG